jgi:hypothetical protein
MLRDGTLYFFIIASEQIVFMLMIIYARVSGIELCRQRHHLTSSSGWIKVAEQHVSLVSLALEGFGIID